MSLLIKNAMIVTMENQIIQNGYIGVIDDRINYVGKTLPQGFVYDRIIDGSNRLVLPGFINMHSHSPMVLMRSYADDLSLHDWLYKKIFPTEEKLLTEDIYWGSMYGIMEMISSGITCFADMYFYMNEVARAVNESGMRACLCTGINDLKNCNNFSKNWYIIENIKLFEEWNSKGNGRITVYLGPHSIYTCNPKLLYYIVDLAHQLKTGIHIHISETMRENCECIEKYNKTPVALLDEIGALSSNTIAAHCVHVNEDDMDILKDRGVSVVYNPSSNLKLGSGITPIKHLLQKGVNVALGTDGASSNNNLNMFEEIHLAALISKGVEMDATLVRAFEALSMATLNGAKALGKETEIGIVKCGMKADLIIINMEKLHLLPMYDVISNLVYSAQASDVETVIIDGKIIMENREFKTIDSEQVVYNVKRIANKIGT